VSVSKSQAATNYKKRQKEQPLIFRRCQRWMLEVAAAVAVEVVPE